MKPAPIYTPDNCRPVHALRYDWTGWCREGTVFPAETLQLARATAPLWAADGLTLESGRVRGDMVQLLFTTTPQVSPMQFAQRAKGRLGHALSKAGRTVTFSRKVAVRTLGDNIRETVEEYVRRQVANSDYVDPRFREFLQEHSLACPDVDLTRPVQLVRGRYWYNLHVVIAVQDRRWPVTREENFATIRDTCFRVARKKGYAISRLAVMPDHVHMALRGNPEHSPEDVALAFLNNLSLVLGYNRCWSEEYYVGTFSEYSAGAIR